jgi:hypothetical protein
MESFDTREPDRARGMISASPYLCYLVGDQSVTAYDLALLARAENGERTRLG